LNNSSAGTAQFRTKIFAWGSNVSGQLGVGGQAEALLEPTEVMELDGDIVAVEAGVHSVYAVCADGTVYAWGENSDGQLGDGTTVSRSAPVKIPGLRDVVAIAAWDAVYALTSDGSVWTWGRHSARQVRNPDLARQIFDSLVPIRIDKLTDVVGVAASANAGFALRRDGGIHSWGGYEFGELGASPMNVERAFYPSWVQRANSGSGAKKSEPVRDGTAIAAGFLGAYALAEDGTLWSWGHNDFGQLGWGKQSAVPASRRVLAELENGEMFPRWPAADKVRNLGGVVAVASKGLTAYALKSDGTVWAWGANDLGQLGRGNIRPPLPDGTLDYSIVPEQVPDLRDVRAMSAMGDTVYVVHRDGRVAAWGDNRNGEIGSGLPAVQPSPTSVRGLSGVRAVAAGIDFAIAIVPATVRAEARAPRTQKSDGCYIATAVYGSYDAPSVVTLRRFRDQRLAKSMVGRALVRTYYLMSPAAAKYLVRIPLLSAVVRRLLDRLVKKLDGPRE